jgi:hypothetical protein
MIGTTGVVGQGRSRKTTKKTRAVAPVPQLLDEKDLAGKMSKQILAIIREQARAFQNMARTQLLHALNLGCALSVVRDEQGYGEWGKWVEGLPFGLRAAQGYIQLHKNREEILARIAASKAANAHPDACFTIKAAFQMIAVPPASNPWRRQ